MKKDLSTLAKKKTRTERHVQQVGIRRVLPCHTMAEGEYDAVTEHKREHDVNTTYLIHRPLRPLHQDLPLMQIRLGHQTRLDAL